MIDLFDPEQAGHNQVTRHGTNGSEYRDAYGQPKHTHNNHMTMEGLLDELSSLARLMADAVRDPETKKLMNGVSLREVRETATVGRDLLNVVARNQELFARNHSIQIIQTAIVEALKELDIDGRNRFLEAFDRNVETLTLRARAA